MRRYLLALLLPLCLSLGLSNMAYASGHDEEVSEEMENAQITKDPEIGYYTLEPDFVTNLASSNPKDKLHYLRVQISLMLFDEQDVTVIAGLNPMIRDAVLSLIAAKDYVSVASSEGRERLRQECRERITSIMQDKIGQDLVRDVLFLSYMYQ